MPWKDTTAMNEKIEFISEWKTGLYSISELCRNFDISRPTAYKIIQRFNNSGYQGLLEHSRAPYVQPNRTNEKVERAIIKLRKKHKNWGARKIWKLLQADFSTELIPSVVTVNAVMKRNGLIIPKKRFRRITPTYPIFDPQVCNETWSADFKGKFLMKDKKYCHPLTIADSKSRYLFAAKGMFRETFKSTKREFKRVFREYGMPLQIHTDNGTPFGSARGIKRFSSPSYWFIDLGIAPVFSDPGQPQQNGRHERMHRDLKAECTSPPAHNLNTQQRKLNHFVKEYNNLRPHEALGLETPQKMHDKSEREYPEKIDEHYYPSHFNVMIVTLNGALRWKSYHWVYIARGLARKYVGLEELGEGIWRVFYRNTCLGYFDEKRFKGDMTNTRLSPNMV